ncbi:DUF4160 domain-containing protein [uncultured Roseibium sp.]|uniref:DUF4160 domain-containing protein n=1 Tax=uncultured Roseibium sp. TaxID=1936171 RepID=UPI003217FDA5
MTTSREAEGLTDHRGDDSPVEYVVAVPDAVVDELEKSFSQGPIDSHGRQEPEHSIEFIVSLNQGMKIEIFAREHPPPHFRVKYKGGTANFAIADCRVLNGDGHVLKYKRNVRLWWKTNKPKLIKAWNETRPADCPVGAYRNDQ